LFDRSDEIDDFLIDGHAASLANVPGRAKPAVRCWLSDSPYRLSRWRWFCRRTRARAWRRLPRAWPATDRRGTAAPHGMGGECMARSARNRGRLDFGRGDKAAGTPAELGGLRAPATSPRDTHSGATAQGVGQAARFLGSAPICAARLVDLARCRDHSRRAALLQPFP
jgi:hypothetical protein